MKPLFAQFWKNRCSHLHTLVKRFQILTRQEVFKILNAHALWQSSPTWIYYPDALRGGPYIIIHLSTLLRAELINVLAGCVPSGLQTLCHPSLNPNRTNCPTAGCPALMDYLWNHPSIDLEQCSRTILLERPHLRSDSSLGSISLPLSLCVLRGPPLPTMYMQPSHFHQLKFSQRMKEK